MAATARLPMLLGVFMLLALGWPSATLAAGADAASVVGTPIRSVYFRPPTGAPSDRPLQVLIALHGMGGDGEVFSRDLAEQADKYGWAIGAPTIA